MDGARGILHSSENGTDHSTPTQVHKSHKRHIRRWEPDTEECALWDPIGIKFKAWQNGSVAQEAGVVVTLEDGVWGRLPGL